MLQNEGTGMQTWLTTPSTDDRIGQKRAIRVVPQSSYADDIRVLGSKDARRNAREGDSEVDGDV